MRVKISQKCVKIVIFSYFILERAGYKRSHEEDAGRK